MHIMRILLAHPSLGPMPSPGPANPISILMEKSQWLEPVSSEPVEIPHHILPGRTVDVPGTVRAFIRHETEIRLPNTILKAEERVTLIANFHKRLDRTLPGFCGSTPYEIRYPLQLTAPSCLKSVQTGDRVRFSWTVHNVSRKAYGIESVLSRYAATRFKDPQAVFDLPYQDENTPHEAIDAVDELAPGEELPIEQDFIVSTMVREYSDCKLDVELLLADPHQREGDGRPKIRPVMKYVIDLQVAGVYQYNPLSRFLLIVNCDTPNWAIHQIIKFIREELRLGLDIANLSLPGSCVEERAKAPKLKVLQPYRGKSIIVYGNPFNYFRKGQRFPWQLMDPWEVCSLAKGGTSFLFLGVQRETENELLQWAKNTVFSAPAKLETAQSSGLLKAFVRQIQSEDQSKYNVNISAQQFQGKSSALSCFRNRSADKVAQKAAKTLTKGAPLRRFLHVPEESPADLSMPMIYVIEGLQRTAKVFSTSVHQEYDPEFNLSDCHKYAIIRAVPISDLAKLFWNAWGISQSNDHGLWLPATALYNGVGWQATQGFHWEGVFLQEKVCLRL
jgi:hypothetical protein